MRSFKCPSPRQTLIAGLVALALCSLITLDKPLASIRLQRRPHSRASWLFPMPATGFRANSWQDVNSAHMRTLIDCTERGTCSANQTKVVIFASWDFTYAIEGHVSGENIWANSVMDALDELGYTYFFAYNHHQLADRYRMLGDLVRIVIAQSPLVHDCIRDPNCIKSPMNLLGVPLWKIFGFEFWENSYMPHPLGKPWTLSPANYRNGNFFLGYTVNRTCNNQAVVPHTLREHRVFVLAKRLSYFFENSYQWPNIDYAHPPHALHDLTFVGSIWNDTAEEEKNVPPSPQIPAGILNLNEANLDADEFYREVAFSKLLLGIGSPPLSPSPYDALCLGVPFLNPVMRWDKNNPENRTAWWTQHDGFKYEQEPYVYHVLKDPNTTMRTQRFWEAIERAVSTPIERYIPEDMTHLALVSRVSALVDTDWRSRAEKLVEAWRGSGDVSARFALYF
ncbi:hypothetical protein EXIGLDRAFT_3583 [Exidia glandulosa HHB12029]|uniref:Glycosyltransferase family 18 catalytic domain-containing protein n=1 Tax=Exidia glandulosa HHB12029 TaxID=1314781 RepID=A0A165QLM6_EXIGL|nr:hypothetical protein EXIGLDRAFT_3583 [Exidia glandulosa HHB12029]